MLTALFTFLGGSVFRMIWGELSSWINKKQDHSHELERMRLELELEDRAHARQQETIRLQHELGVQQIQVQRDADVARSDAQAFTEAMKDAFKPTGIWFVDAWNGSIRPQYAQLALVLWGCKVAAQGFVMDDYDRDLIAVILGFFFADRVLSRRGK
jgi:hypothetical protein